MNIYDFSRLLKKLRDVKIKYEHKYEAKDILDPSKYIVYKLKYNDLELIGKHGMHNLNAAELKKEFETNYDEWVENLNKSVSDIKIDFITTFLPRLEINNRQSILSNYSHLLNKLLNDVKSKKSYVSNYFVDEKKFGKYHFLDLIKTADQENILDRCYNQQLIWINELLDFINNEKENIQTNKSGKKDMVNTSQQLTILYFLEKHYYLNYAGLPENKKQIFLPYIINRSDSKIKTHLRDIRKEDKEYFMEDSKLDLKYLSPENLNFLHGLFKETNYELIIKDLNEKLGK